MLLRPGPFPGGNTLFRTNLACSLFSQATLARSASGGRIGTDDAAPPCNPLAAATSTSGGLRRQSSSVAMAVPVSESTVTAPRYRVLLEEELQQLQTSKSQEGCDLQTSDTMRQTLQRSREGSRTSRCGFEEYLQHEEKALLLELYGAWAASVEEGPSFWRRELLNSTSVTQMCSGEGLSKRPSFWVRSERCAVGGNRLPWPAGDLLLAGSRALQSEDRSSEAQPTWSWQCGSSG